MTKTYTAGGFNAEKFAANVNIDDMRYFARMEEAFLNLPQGVKFDIVLTDALGSEWSTLSADSKTRIFEAFLERDEGFLVSDAIFDDVEEAAEEESEQELADYLDRMLIMENLPWKRVDKPRYDYGFIDFGGN